MLQARDKVIPGWKVDAYDLTGVLPQSPVEVPGTEEIVELIPMGAARLGIASFPVAK